MLDPQQRIFLETAWQALEDAGRAPDRRGVPIGVFAGTGLNEYLLRHIAPNRELVERAGPFQVSIQNDKDFVATRTSYKLGLKGPSINVQTACSTSLVAVHLACNSLRNGECATALAGGVSVHAQQVTGYLYQEGLILSPDGHCRAFDKRAGGTVGGNGAGVVVLRRLEDALADGDNIRAVIKATAINNDGALKVGFTAPGLDGQREVIGDALARSGVALDSIGYIEAHGTGTPMGDPIEMGALRTVFGARGKGDHIAIGSLKTNIGHLDTAAGVAGLIKTVMALHHEQIPPSLHFEEPNPEIDLEGGPFYVNDRLQPWPRSEGQPRRAGVSSFGIGGTNVHAVLEEAPPAPESDAAGPCHLLLLSAHTEAALEANTIKMAEHMAGNPETNLADAAFTLATGRGQFPLRRFLVCADASQAAAMLGDTAILATHHLKDEMPPSPVFLFSGQGSQYIHMAEGLYQREPFFRDLVDQCAALLEDHLETDLRQQMFPAEEVDREAAASALTATETTQPALFVVEYCLARLWQHWGIQPEAMLGHSIGEYVAACLAGVFSLEDGLELVALRGRLMASLPAGGAMLSVPLAEDALTDRLGDALSLAVINGASRCVVAGREADIDALAATLKKEQVSCRKLQVSHAFHSLLVEPILAEFTEKVKGFQLHPPQIPYVSNVTGDWVTPQQATDPAYWAAHLRGTVRFHAGLATLMAEGNRLLLEVGPGNTLKGLATRHPDRGDQPALSSLRHIKESTDDQVHLYRVLGELWQRGLEIDWSAFFGGQKRLRVPLPVYAFDRRRFWIEAPSETGASTAVQPQKKVAVPAHAKTAEKPAPAEEAAPASAQAKVAAIWREALGIEEIGPEDDFFQLGGDSLVASQVLTRVRDSFNLEISLDLLFANTTLAKLAEAIDKIADPKTADHAPISHAPRTHDLPLSFGQLRLWFLNQLDPESAVYNMSTGIGLEGELRTDVLEQALARVVNRQESLRTTIAMIDDYPILEIAPTGEVDLPYEDLRHLSEQERTELVALRTVEEVDQPFALDQRLFRTRLLRTGETSYVLFICMHHIISDGWSIQLFISEIAAIYSSLLEEREPQLPVLAIQYADFAWWQREGAGGQMIADQLSYWSKKLNGVPKIHGIPTDRPRPPIQSSNGALELFDIDPALYAKLEKISLEAGVSLFMTTLAVFKILISRYSGREDIVVGSPIANRDRAEFENLIGFFVNTLALRTIVPANLSFRELLARVKETTLEAFSHQTIPFEQVVETIKPERDLSYNPLVQIVFALQRDWMKMSVPGLTLTNLPGEHVISKFELTLAILEREEGPGGAVEYNTDLFDVTTIQRMIDHFLILLRGIAADQDAPIADLFLDGYNGSRTLDPGRGYLGKLPPSTVRGAGGPDAHSGCHSGHGRKRRRGRHLPDLCGVGQSRQPTCALPARKRRGRRQPGCIVHGARAGNDRRLTGHSQSGRRLPAHGSCLARRPPHLHDGRCACAAGSGQSKSGRTPSAGHGCADPAGGFSVGSGRSPASVPAGNPRPPGQHRLRHLHLRLYR